MPKVKEIDHDGIFERAAGHPAKLQTVMIVCGPREKPMSDTMTTNGVRKPVAFTLTPRRREQFYI